MVNRSDAHAVGRFNSRTPGGVRHKRYRDGVGSPISFNSRTPGGVRRSVAFHSALSSRFQFTHPGRGATHGVLHLVRFLSFNSRTPGGVRPHRAPLPTSSEVFQFTHPGRGATIRERNPFKALAFQFTHPGRGATYNRLNVSVGHLVSIHAPREGCDTSSALTTLRRTPFQFTHPGRGAT